MSYQPDGRQALLPYYRLAMRERIQTAMYTRQSMLQERFNAMEQSRLDDIAARYAPSHRMELADADTERLWQA